MKIFFLQKIIDYLRCKKNKVRYNQLKITCKYLRNHCNLNNKILERIINRKTWYFYKQDKRNLQLYLNSIDALNIPSGRCKENSMINLF